jgi:dihydroorotate dehydrogenase
LTDLFDLSTFRSSLRRAYFRINGKYTAYSRLAVGMRSLNAKTLVPVTVKRVVSLSSFVAVGGVMNPLDALAKFKAGATLVQIYTGLVAGPGLVKQINRALLERAA